ncbi:MAG: hypothetical protein KDA50_12775 [Rhodobacteraceae bacterium]|nr:hypothetical protein [Paracoccaceae bacterium]
MFLELIATFVIGLGAAGVIMLANRLTGRRLPRWFIPAGAGLAMISFTIWSEYAWYNHTASGLPEGVEIAWVNEDRAMYRPWTYVVPQKNRFVAVDHRTVRTNDALPDQKMVDLFFMGRWAPSRQVRVVLDCAANRRADLMEGVGMDESGAVEDSAWVPVDPKDPVLRTACKEEDIG